MTYTSPFSVQLTAGSRDSTTDVDAALITGERRNELAAQTKIDVSPGSLHRLYPATESDSESIAVVTNPSVIVRLAKAVTDLVPEPAALAQPHSDVVLDCYDEEDDLLTRLHIAGGRVQDEGMGSAWMVDPADLADVLGAAGVPQPYQPSTLLRRTPTPALRSPAGDALTQQWLKKLPGSRPISHELRTALPDRWIRFHSLPESKRYADNEPAYLEILRRHHGALEALPGGNDILVMTSSGSLGVAVVERPVSVEALAANSWYWDTIIVEQDDNLVFCTHRWVETLNRNDGRLDQLLRMEIGRAHV